MSFIGRIISSPVGLAAEAYQHNKQKKSQAPSSPSPNPSDHDRSQLPRDIKDDEFAPRDAPPAYEQTPGLDLRGNEKSHLSPNDHDDDDDDYTTEEEEDEADWARDETQAQLTQGENPDLKTTSSVDKFVRQHIAAFPRSSSNDPPRLEIPVIIPQRRPETRERGFIRAYAPALEPCDVPQDAFLHFLDGFTAVISEQKWFWAVNGAVAVTGLAMTATAVIPLPITHASLFAIHWSVEMGRRGYESNAVNRYLDAMNAEYFKPRGLYALIMTHDPYSSKKAQQVSLDANMMKSIQARDSGHRNNLHASSGHAAELQIPASAPLVFPALAAASDAEKQSALSRATGFARDYMDRRARSTFARENPASKLNDLHETKPAYAASIADPSHPMWHGGLLTLLSGGHIPSRRQRRRSRAERHIDAANEHGYAPGRRDQRVLRRDDARNDRREMLRTARKKGYTPLGFVKRTIGQHVVYLMIVPYPTEAEFAEYDAAIAREKARGEGHVIE